MEDSQHYTKKETLSGGTGIGGDTMCTALEKAVNIWRLFFLASLPRQCSEPTLCPIRITVGIVSQLGICVGGLTDFSGGGAIGVGHCVEVGKACRESAQSQLDMLGLRK